MASSLQAEMLLGAPAYPNAIAWSEENLIAVASGHIVTILKPALANGPRGVVKVSTSEPLPIGVVEREDLHTGCLLPACLSRDDKPSVRSISWSPLGMASNSGCLLAVCTTEGHVKAYRPPFCDFCSEWVEVLDITKRLYEYLQHTEFGDSALPSLDHSKIQLEKQRSADDMPNTVSRKGNKRSKINGASRDSGNPLLFRISGKDGNKCSSPSTNIEGQTSDMVSEINLSDQTISVSNSKGKSLKKLPENHIIPQITADQYAFRSAMLCSLVVSWSPLLHATSERYPVPNTYTAVSLLAVGGKSGKISLWRFDPPDCYTIEDGKVSTSVNFVGLLQAHDSWVTTISWVLFSSDTSNPQILLATGSSNGSVKVWLGNNDTLLNSSEVNQTSFSLLKEVITVNVVPVSVLSVAVPVQSYSEMLLAIGKGSGSFEIWLCDISRSKFHKLGSYDAHDHVVTGLVWAFDGRCLYSCSQDNLVRSWILHENHIDEATFPSEIPHSSNSTSSSTDAFDSCFGAVVSPGNLVAAMVHCFDVEKLNRMYEGRILKAAIEYFWIGGQQVDVLLKTPLLLNVEGFPIFQEKEITYWGANIIWSLRQYQCLDKPLVVWDIIAALLAFKEYESKYVEQILIKWLSMSFLGSDANLSIEMVLSNVSSKLSDIPSRLLHLLNIICRRVMLAELDADQINRKNDQLQNLGSLYPAKEKQITNWTEILLSSERELRERLVALSFSAFLANGSYSEATSSRPCPWYPIGVAQMQQWVALEQDHVHDQLKVLASKVRDEKRSLSGDFLAVEPCSYCSAPVPVESPEVGFCQGEGYTSGSAHRHRLLRCSVSMQVCPITPLWFCICCRRSAFRLAPETLFGMSAYPAAFKSSIRTSSQAVSSKPMCPFCGILLQRQLPEYLLSPTPVDLSFRTAQRSM